jgi:hypothetical protein
MTTRQRIVISILLAAAVVGIVFAFQLAEEPEDAVVHRDSRVTAIFPDALTTARPSCARTPSRPTSPSRTPGC